MESKKESILFIILKNLISPFPLMILFASFIYLLGSFFIKSGYSQGLILFIVYLVFVGVFVFIEHKKEGFRKSKIYKEYIDLSKMIASLTLLLAAVVAVTSLFYRYDVPLIIQGVGNIFILILPLNLPVLYLFKLGEDEEITIVRFKGVLIKQLPFLVAEIIITLLISLFGFGFAFNPVELLVINLFASTLLFLNDFLLQKDGENPSEIPSFTKKDLLIPSILGGVLGAILFGLFLVSPIEELIDSGLTLSLFSIKETMIGEADVRSSAQCYIYIAMVSAMSIYIYFFTTNFKEKLNVRKLILSLVALLIPLIIVLVPWVKTFIYSNARAFVDQVYAFSGGILFFLIAFITNLINKRIAKTKKSN